MTSSDRFEKLKNTYNAIRDIDRLLLLENEDCKEKIDEVINIIKDIDKREFDLEYQNSIVSIIRSALLKIYKTDFDSLNREINLSNDMEELRNE